MSVTSDPSPEQEPDRHPLDEPPTTVQQYPTTDQPEAGTPARRRRGLGGGRHLTSVILALLAVPASYACIDYGYYRALGYSSRTLDDVDLPQKVVAALVVAAGLMFLAALTGRISALGPLVAGLVWGVAPLVWVLLDFSSYLDRLNDLPESYDNTGFGLYTAGFALYPAVAGLLIGTAVAGRWRRHATPVA